MLTFNSNALQDSPSEVGNGSSLRSTRKSVTPSTRIIINPASRTFIHPDSPTVNGTDSHKAVRPRSRRSREIDLDKTLEDFGDTDNARITRSMRRGAISNGDVTNKNVKDKTSKSVRNGTAKAAELLKVSKDVDINRKSTVYRFGIKRKAQTDLSKRASKLLKTSKSQRSSRSRVKIPESARSKTRSPPSLRKSSVSLKDVSTETEPVPPPKVPVRTKHVATETSALSPPKPSVSSKDVATGTEPMSPPKLPKSPAQLLQPPEVCTNLPLKNLEE